MYKHSHTWTRLTHISLKTQLTGSITERKGLDSAQVNYSEAQPIGHKLTHAAVCYWYENWCYNCTKQPY